MSPRPGGPRGYRAAVTWVRDEPEGQDEGILQEFFETMAAEKLDVVVQMHGGGHFSNPFLKRLGARITVGLRSSDAIPLDRWVPYIYFQHEVLRYLEVAALLDAPCAHLEPRVCVTEHDVSEVEALLPQSADPLVALHPGAGDPRRRWPADKFAEVGDAVAGTGARVVLIGTAVEREAVEAVSRMMARPPLNFSERLSLCGLIGLLSRCHLLVGNDSGPLHLARTLGVSTLGLYWCGNFINAGPMTRTRHRVAIGVPSVRRALPGRTTRPHRVVYAGSISGRGHDAGT